MTITPDQADRLKIDATDGPWFVHTDHDDPDGTYIYNDPGHMCVAIEPLGSDYRPADLDLIAAAPDLAQTIAGMRWQYGAKCGSDNRLIWRVRQEDAESLVASMSRIYPEGSCRLVRRLVGPIEPIDKETPND